MKISEIACSRAGLPDTSLEFRRRGDEDRCGELRGELRNSRGELRDCVDPVRTGLSDFVLCRFLAERADL